MHNAYARRVEVARFRARLAAGEEDLVPAAVVDRLLAGGEPGPGVARAPGPDAVGAGAGVGVNRVVVADIEAGRKGGSVRSLKGLAGALSLPQPAPGRPR